MDPPSPPSAGTTDGQRLVIGSMIVSTVIAVSAVSSWMLFDDGTRTGTEVAQSVGLSSGILGVVAAACVVYWDAWTFKALGLQIGGNTAGGWLAFVLLFALIGLPAYLYRRVRVMSPSPATRGTTAPTDTEALRSALERPDGNGIPATMGALIGVGLVAAMVMTPWISLLVVSDSVTDDGPVALDTVATERQMEQWVYANTGYTVDVKCPETAWQVGGSFYCSFTDMGQVTRIRGVMMDAAGTVTWAVG